ncbi:hypothetical protein [Ideonella sp. YS5]|uniref:hypothetical protein n=1 Tax=Ideonella sp. YS5 TaxID=3453714 RepID=UPI003EEE3F62
MARLDERIASLETVHERIRADEVSGLKTLERPKDKHVHRLLELGEIQAVTAPVKLPSDGDVGALGTLFEMVIQPRRTPGGEVPRPIFLHVHTRTPVTEEQCLALDFDAFSAAHVKNAWQKNLGPRWEQMQSSRENAGGRRDQAPGSGGNADAPRIHRGRVGEQLWKKLRDQVG